MLRKKGQEIGFGITIFFIILGIVVIGAFLGFDQVEPSHKGVMVQFGTLRGVMESGFQWTGLFTHVFQYDMRIRKANLVMDGDFYAPDKAGQRIYAQIDVNYKLKTNSVESLYKNVGEDKDVEDKLNIKPIITESFKRATVKFGALEILDKREEVAQLAEQNIHDKFPKEYFDIVSVVISNIHFSPDFQNAIEASKTAVQLTNVAEQNLNKVKFEQQQEVEKYKAQAEQLRLQKAEVTALLNQQAWIAKWDGKLPLYMITTPDNANVLLTLPQGGQK